MNKPLLTLTASAFLLASTMGIGQAQTTDDEETMQQGERGQAQQPERMMQQDRQGKKRYGRHRDRRSGMMRHHGMRHGMCGGMGMGGGMGGGMGHGAMMHVLFAIMDANGDGSLSLEEVQESHARIFAHMDADDDDQVTKEEIKDFFRGKSDRRGAATGDGPDDTDEPDMPGDSDEADE